MFWMLLLRYIGSWGWEKMRSTSYVSKSGKKAAVSSKPKKSNTGIANVGREDCMLHAIVGTIALFLLLMIKDGFVIRYLLGLTALIGLLTALTRFSPVYALLGENTRKKYDLDQPQ